MTRYDKMDDRGRNKNVKLFGFELTMTSALLLFITSAMMLIAGFVGMYSVISTYNATSYFPMAIFLLYLVILAFGFYIFIQTIRFRGINR